MITFADARELVAAAERDLATRIPDYVVLPRGYEDEHAFRVIAGSARDFDPTTPLDEVSTDVQIRLVDKRTGAISYWNPVSLFGRLDRMTPVEP